MKKIFTLLFLVCSFSFLCGEEAKTEKSASQDKNHEEHSTICLNMIVKNEQQVIRRCLESVKPLIDYWVIVDTGSDDKTKEIIQEFMKDIPGELHERPWVNFAHNRNEALALAKNKADYVLFIDADDTLAIDANFARKKLDKDFYYLKTKYNSTIYRRVQLVKNALDWTWRGVVHETISCPKAGNAEHLDGVTMVIIGGGDRSHDPNKFLKDAKMLEESLKTDPYNTRSIFYLAQSYRDAGKKELACKTYEKRVAMRGWDEEVFWSLYQIALLQESLNAPEQDICKRYCDAFGFRPTRVEPLYWLSRYYRLHENYLLGYIIAKYGLEIKPPDDLLFVESWMYDYGLLLEYSVCAYWLGKYEECFSVSKQILGKPDLPDHVRECVEKNYQFALEKLSSRSRERHAELRKAVSQR